MKKTIQGLCQWSSRLFHMAFVALFVVLGTSLALAQNKSVSGTVIDSYGDPVIGANVLVKGTSNGTLTDVDGKFTLSNMPAKATLQISFVGYETAEVAYTGQAKVSVTLAENAEMLDEVVAIGYGSVKKTTLTAAVSKMDNKGIENRPLARAETALQGQLAGVQVRTVTGEPGADMQIRVRGAASVNASSDPLYVVDGVPMNTLSGINPADIETIEVLKDAASSAIYGSRGSNGVVMVTTKKGKSGKAKVSFNASAGVQNLEKKLDILSATEWMELRLRFCDAQYMNQLKSKKIEGSISDSNSVRAQKTGTKNNYNYLFDERWLKYLSPEIQQTHTLDDPTAAAEELCLLDWQDEFFRNALTQDYGLNVSGATESTKYMFSGGYMNQEGLAVGTKYQRFSFRTNVETKLNKYFTVGMNLAPTYIINDGSGNANGKDSQVHQALTSTPVSEPGVWYNTNAVGNNKYNWAGSASSPVLNMKMNTNQSRDIRFVGSAFMRITPIQDLNIELSASTQMFDRDRNTYNTTAASGNWAQGEGQKSSADHYTDRSMETLLQAVANYTKTLGDGHNLNAMLGSSVEYANMGFSTSQRFNSPFPNDAIQGTFDGSKLTVRENKVTEKTSKNLASFFGRVQYDYKERYMLSASLRYDGCSIFGADNKWGMFPAASLGWMASNEEFFKNWGLDWWNTFKVRASYGETGNNSISYSAAYPTLTNVSYGGAAGYYANSLGNANLGWEKTKSTDIALDFGFLRNRIQLSLDYYTKTTNDLLYQVPSLGVSGFTSTWDNLGEVQNKGFEVELNTKNLTGAFQWNTSFNFSYNKNEVISLGVDDTPIYSGFTSNQWSNILEVGRPINTFWMYEAVGVWQTQAEIDAWAQKYGKAPTFQGKKVVPGDIRYNDVTGDGIIDTDDKTYLGQPTPKCVFGMTNTFSWKGFDASILVTAQTGGKIFGVFGRANDRPSMGASANVLGRWRNAWWSEQEPGDGHTPYLLSSTTGTTLDSRWLYSSDYLRIKNLTVGYKIPVNPKILSYLRVYCSIENLARWDHYYGGYSPEAANTASSSSPGGQSAVGLDYGSYPIPRIVTFGININF